MCGFGVTYNFIIIYNLCGMFYCEGIIVMFVMHLVFKKIGILDMVWCVGLRLKGVMCSNLN